MKYIYNVEWDFWAARIWVGQWVSYILYGPLLNRNTIIFWRKTHKNSWCKYVLE
jgi:hypothetical protein